jgi:EAL domain-containing protein (putative c-di-GMP-specific phosphodiesterase class I)/GGDEF domain-containing protein
MTAWSNPDIENVQQHQDQTAPDVFENLHKARERSELEWLRATVQGTGLALYHWNVLTDAMAWSDNAAELLGLGEGNAPVSGTAFTALLEKQFRDCRDAAIVDNAGVDDGNGIVFSLRYRLAARHGETTGTFIEESGRARSDAQGNMREVTGYIRKLEGDIDLEAGSTAESGSGMVSRDDLLAVLAAAPGKSESGTSGLLVLEILNVASISESYGPAVVPEVVRAVAARLRSVMRGADVLGQIGSSRFAIVLHECTTEQIDVAGARFVAAIRDDVIETPHGPVWVEFGASGIVLPTICDSPQEALVLAEETLMLSSFRGDASYKTYEPLPEAQELRQQNRETAAQFIKALRNDRFTLWHQPVVDGASKAPVMYESLLRMLDADDKIIRASQLVPVAEKLGFMHMIDAMVCRSSIDLVCDHQDCRIGFNLSDGTLRDPFAAEQIKGMLRDAGELASRLCAEVRLESHHLNIPNTRALLEFLRESGCQLAVDGYYTLGIDAEILKFADIVKLEGMICKGIAGRADDVPLLNAAVDFAHRMDVKVCGQHVETQEDADVLIEAGVDLLQGHLFGKAAPDHFDIVLSSPDESIVQKHASASSSSCGPHAPACAPNMAGGGAEPVQRQDNRDEAMKESASEFLKAARGKLAEI